MQVKNFLLILLTIPLFSGCLFSTPEVVVQTEYVEKTIPIVPHPKKVTLHGIKFYVVTEENYEAFSEGFVKKNGDLVYIAISIKDYENLSLNMSELHRYLKQQKNVIKYYETSVTPTKEKETNER